MTKKGRSKANNKKPQGRKSKTKMKMGQPARQVSGSVGVNYSGTMQKHGSNTTRICGCDMVSDILADDTFAVSEERINPGNNSLFPRLSHLAPIFEKYKFHKLIFKYFPVAPATQIGFISFMVETDIVDAAPTDKSAFLNHYNSRRTQPWNSMALSVAKRDLHPRPQMFNREATAPTTATDQRLDDVGALYIATQTDSTTAQPVGELWVEYDVEFISPCVPSVTAEMSSEYDLEAPASAYGSNTGVLTAMQALAVSNLDNIAAFGDPASGFIDFIFSSPFQGLIDARYVRTAGATPISSDWNFSSSNLVTTSASVVEFVRAHQDPATAGYGVAMLRDEIATAGTLWNNLSDVVDLASENVARLRYQLPSYPAGATIAAIIQLLSSAKSIGHPWVPHLSETVSSNKRFKHLLRFGRFHNQGKPMKLVTSFGTFETDNQPISRPVYNKPCLAYSRCKKASASVIPVAKSPTDGNATTKQQKKFVIVEEQPIPLPLKQ